MRKFIISIFLLFLSFNSDAECSKPVSGGSASGVESGCFDYYLFRQAWWPQFCLEAPQGTCQELTKQMQTQLGIHGLWPQFYAVNNESAYPVNCVDSPGCNSTEVCQFDSQEVSDKKLNTVTKFMTLYLLEHEWSKHGTCINYNQEHYVDAMIMVQSKFKTPKIISDNIGKTVDFQNLVNAYGGEEYVSLKCSVQDGIQYLNEIEHILDKDFNIMKKPEDSTSSCSAADLIFIKNVNSE